MKKKSFLILLTLIIVKSSFAQLKSPNASPRSNISQIIGLVSVNLDYSRPSKKSREIFGGLVPYNKIWRTGANNPTTISFSDYVKINNQLISAGEYHLYSVPTESTLDLVIYEKTDAWGSLPTFDKSKVIARVSSDFIDLPNTVETFTISFENISNNGGLGAGAFKFEPVSRLILSRPFLDKPPPSATESLPPLLTVTPFIAPFFLLFL